MLESANTDQIAWRRRISADALRLSDWCQANWKFVAFLCWMGIATFYLSQRWSAVQYLALGDTDDNIRFVQVKDWLAGQGWFDLRQYRLAPPEGANIHWSRLVDMPIAALMLFFGLLFTPAHADQLAVGIAPLLPLYLLMISAGFITRRLAPDSNAWIIAVLAPLAAQMGLGMFMPLRIDHHGWQLALVMTMMAGLVDRHWVRGGVVAGLASALSIAIGMEMIVYLAAGGALIALRWVFKDGATRRMRPYALSLTGGVGACFLLFASYDNRQFVCDAISPIWVTIFSLAGGGMILLTLLPLTRWPQRLIAGLVVGGAVGLVAWLNWPQCLTGAYQIAPELERNWLANIREAKPIYLQNRSVVLPLMPMPVMGIIGALGLFFWLWAQGQKRDVERLWAAGTVALMTIFAFALMFWQTRAGPAAQLLAIPAAAWLAWSALRAVLTGQSTRWKLAGFAGLVVVAAVFGAYQLVPMLKAGTPLTEKAKVVRGANARCRAQPALIALNALPPATIFTMVDLGPRLIAMTHHRAIAGPYHRNGDAILDIHHAFDRDASQFRAIAARRGAKYLLICPNFPEGTVYHARSPKGFYANLMRGNVPVWLEPVALDAPAALPFKLYRIDYQRR